jgi:Chitobiase/beta-hexosaminidase C-terminal domain
VAVDIGAFELFPTQNADIPIVSPLGGTYESSVQISIAATSTRAIVHYTLDGSDPDSGNGLVYTAPFTLTQNTTVKAIAYGHGWLDSPVASVDYTVLPPLPFWRNLQGLPADGSQDLANPSGDGVVNLLKYAFNLAPNAGDLTKNNYQILSANGTAGLPLITRDGQDRLVIAFVRRKASTNPGVTYVVETSEDLTSLQPLDLSSATVTDIDANWERVTVTDPTVSTKRFGRVRVNY